MEFCSVVARSILHATIGRVSQTCSNTGWYGEALAKMSLARELDPVSALMYAMEGKFLLHADRTDQALACLREALELDPNARWPTRSRLVRVLKRGSSKKPFCKHAPLLPSAPEMQMPSLLSVCYCQDGPPIRIGRRARSSSVTVASAIRSALSACDRVQRPRPTRRGPNLAGMWIGAMRSKNG